MKRTTTATTLLIALMGAPTGCAHDPATGRRVARVCLLDARENGESSYPSLAGMRDAPATQAAAEALVSHLEQDGAPLETDVAMELAELAVRWFASLDPAGRRESRCDADSPVGRERAAIERALSAALRALERRVVDPAPLDYARARIFRTDMRPDGCSDDVDLDPRIEAVLWYDLARQSEVDIPPTAPPAVACQPVRSRGLRFHGFVSDYASRVSVRMSVEGEGEGLDSEPSPAEGAERGQAPGWDLLGRHAKERFQAALSAWPTPITGVAIVVSSWSFDLTCISPSQHLVVQVGGRWRYAARDREDPET